MTFTRRSKILALINFTFLSLITAAILYSRLRLPDYQICYGPYLTAGFQTPIPTLQEYNARFAPCFLPGFAEKQIQSLPKDFNPDLLHLFYIQGAKPSFQGGPIFVDDSGNIVLAYNYPSVGTFSQGLASVSTRIEKNGSLHDYGYIDPSGKIVIPPVYDYTEPFHEGRAVVGKNNLYGFIDLTGKPITPFKYASLTPFNNGVATGHLPSPDSRQFIEYLDLQGQVIPNHQPNPPSEFSQGLKPAYQSRTDNQLHMELWGYQDESGQWVIPPRFVDAEPFSDGLAAVAVICDPPPNYKRKNKDEPSTWASWGYIDKTGTLVIPPNFDHAQPFSHGIARIQANACHDGLIDKSGKLLFSITHPDFRPEITADLKPAPPIIANTPAFHPTQSAPQSP